MKTGNKRAITLGLAETVLCAVLMWAVSVMTGNYRYIILWSLLGWTQLLRTRQSTTLGLRMFAPAYRWLGGFLHLCMLQVKAARGKWFKRHDTENISHGDDDGDPVSIGELLSDMTEFLMASKWFAPFVLILYGLAAFTLFAALLTCLLLLVLLANLFRMVSVFWVCVRHPSTIPRAIAVNWRRVAWKLELASPLEFMPRHRLQLRIANSPALRARRAWLQRMQWAPPKKGRFQYPRFDVSGCGDRPSHAAEEQFASVSVKFGKGSLGAAVRVIPVVLCAAALVSVWNASHWKVGPPLPSSLSVEHSQTLKELRNKLNELRFELAAKKKVIEAVQGLREDEPRGVPSESAMQLFKETELLEAMETQLEEAERVRMVGEQLRRVFEERFVYIVDVRRPLTIHETARRLFLSGSLSESNESIYRKTAKIFLYLVVLGVFGLFYAMYFGLWCLVFLYALSTPLRVLLFTPALAYRLSIKASALTYAPLFFIGEVPYAKITDPKQAFEREQEAAWPTVQRFIAKVGALALLGAVIVATFWSSIVTSLSTELAMALRPWFVCLYPSHLASAMTLVLTFCIWYLTKDCLWRLKQGNIFSLEVPYRWVLLFQRLRSTLSIYTMIWSIYWAATTAWPFLRNVNLPVVRWVLLPWKQ